ncbi:glycoside hydrolase family 15 [Microbacterium sp. MEC084]|uniref:glycoside hydrolase family 15 protein n=1 Tax=Microbacterium sp. MEC084 TaxID=1963027 RepID=UPI00106F7922|nr:glycoside hydrolase family 15 protein [Microbacterium sp. MEC084]MCD1269347.1 glycoside hydrolase family 15 [Microbacterium sp. MEC084]
MTASLAGPEFEALLARSRDLIRSLQDAGGAYPASPTFSAYRGYSWFRDGAFIADAMSAVGEPASAEAFFDWCARVILRHRVRVEAIIEAERAGAPLADELMLPTRFTFSGDVGTDDWWDFQLDGYGTWMWAAAAHAQRHGSDVERWRDAAELTVDYLIGSWQRPCYDWWEEHSEHVHPSTLGCIVAGLESAADSGMVLGSRAAAARAAAAEIRALLTERGVADGHLVKWIGSVEVDGSLSALVAPLGVIEPGSDLARGTVAEVASQLCVDGGVYRFREDTYFGGGRWPLLSCFLGLAQLANGDRDSAERLLAWAASTETPEGHIPEQVDGPLLDASHRQAWIDRWGPPATPLLWSHAMVLRLAAELGLAGGTGSDVHEEVAA